MNDPYAITSIGSFYHMGKIVPQDDSQALKIYLKMYRRLNPNSAFNLSFMHRKGLGTNIDIELSKKYYLDSIIFAIREACNKDESGYQYLKEVVHLSAEYIEECVDRYRKRPICELCHGIVPHENLKAITNNEITSLDLRQKLFNVILNNDFKR